jgi:hypothetical protein
MTLGNMRELGTRRLLVELNSIPERRPLFLVTIRAWRICGITLAEAFAFRNRSGSLRPSELIFCLLDPCSFP